MDREPGPLLALGGLLHALPRGLRDTAARAIEARAGPARLIEDPVRDPHEDSGVRARVLRPEDHPDLAVPQLLLPIDEDPEPPGVVVGAQAALVHGDLTPSDLHPARIHLAGLDERDRAPFRLRLHGPWLDHGAAGARDGACEQ